MAEGRSNQAIATALFVTDKTVTAHVRGTRSRHLHETGPAARSRPPQPGTGVRHLQLTRWGATLPSLSCKRLAATVHIDVKFPVAPVKRPTS